MFEQNWLLTMIQGSYLGLAYDAWLLVSFLFLCDVWLSPGRLHRPPRLRVVGVVDVDLLAHAHRAPLQRRVLRDFELAVLAAG